MFVRGRDTSKYQDCREDLRLLHPEKADRWAEKPTTQLLHPYNEKRPLCETDETER